MPLLGLGSAMGDARAVWSDIIYLLGHTRSAFFCERDRRDFLAELGLAAGVRPSSCSHFCAQSAMPGQT